MSTRSTDGRDVTRRPTHATSLNSCTEATMSLVDYPAERRQRRSNRVRQAITYQLQHLQESFDLDHLVLADEQGLRIAGSGSALRGSAIAAFSPVLHRAHANRRPSLVDEMTYFVPDVDPDRMTVRAFDLQDETHFLCVVGDERLQREAMIYRAVTGIRRIVKQTKSN